MDIITECILNQAKRSGLTKLILEHFKCFEKLGFMLMLSVSPTHEYYRETDQYYYWRCRIAHGRISEFPELTLPTIFDRIGEMTEAIDKIFVVLK